MAAAATTSLAPALGGATPDPSAVEEVDLPILQQTDLAASNRSVTMMAVTSSDAAPMVAARGGSSTADNQVPLPAEDTSARAGPEPAGEVPAHVGPVQASWRP